MVVPDLSPLSRRKEILEGGLDFEFMPEIAHEAAHHACLATSVGNALCSLWQSSFSLWYEQAGNRLPQQPARDLAVAYVANTLLKPLFEGLALFCEHDLTSGISPVVSNVTLRVAPLFTRGRIVKLLARDPELRRSIAAAGRDAFSVAHTEILALARSSREWADRKRDLLSQPLGDDKRYFLGYLAVKGMYGALVPSCPDLGDPELFFVTVVKHFLNDAALTDILLRMRKSTEDPRQAYLAMNQDLADLFTRFQDLMDELYADPAKAAKRASESALQKKSPDAERQVPFSDIVAGTRTVGTFNVAWPKLLNHRQEFRFSFQSVIIRLSKDGTASVKDYHDSYEICQVTTVQACRPLKWEEGESDLPFEGSIEAVQLRNFETFVVCILSSDGLVALFDCESGQWNPEALIEQLDDMPSAIAVEGALNVFNEWNSRTKGNGDIRSAIENCEQQARQTRLPLWNHNRGRKRRSF